MASILVVNCNIREFGLVKTVFARGGMKKEDNILTSATAFEYFTTMMRR